MHKVNYPVLIAFFRSRSSPVAYADDAPQATSSSQNPTETVVVTGTREGEQNYQRAHLLIVSARSAALLL